MEVTGRWHRGDDNVMATETEDWTVGALLFVSLAPPYLTRLEERIEANTRAPEAP